MHSMFAQTVLRQRDSPLKQPGPWCSTPQAAASEIGRAVALAAVQADPRGMNCCGERLNVVVVIVSIIMALCIAALCIVFIVCAKRSAKRKARAGESGSTTSNANPVAVVVHSQ